VVSLRHKSPLTWFMMTAARLFPVLRLAFRRVAAAPRSTSRLYAPGSAPILFLKCFSAHAFSSSSQNPRSPLPSKKCPSCSRPLASPIPACTNCWSIFSLSPEVTYHELFGLPYEPNPFAVDLVALKQRFRQAQAVCHPDTWTSKGPVSLGAFRRLVE
jgi:molecular chaperone HscB